MSPIDGDDVRTARRGVRLRFAASVVWYALLALAAADWAILYRLDQALPRILDPNGPTVSLPPPVEPGFDQLKQGLQPQD
jgi:hypothetical protein